MAHRWVRPSATVRVHDSCTTCSETCSAQGAHLARVLDDEGAVLFGVATLEDVLEEPVGEIRDAAHAED